LHPGLQLWCYPTKNVVRIYGVSQPHFPVCSP